MRQSQSPSKLEYSFSSQLLLMAHNHVDDAISISSDSIQGNDMPISSVISQSTVGYCQCGRSEILEYLVDHQVCNKCFRQLSQRKDIN